MIIEEIFEEGLWIFEWNKDMEYLLEADKVEIKRISYNKKDIDLAIYAKEDIKKGELIIKEKVFLKGTKMEIIKELYKDKSKIEYLRNLKGKSIEEIVNNNIQKEFLDSEEYGLWKYCSLLNHSENENIERRIYKGIFEIIAVKDIKEGEILVYDYTESKKLEKYLQKNTNLTKREIIKEVKRRKKEKINKLQLKEL